MFSNMSQIISHPCIAVDLGTANTRVYTSFNDAMTEVPSVLSCTTKGCTALATGNIDFDDTTCVTKLLHGGVIANLQNVTLLLRPLVKRKRQFMLAPIALVSVPTGTTVSERALFHQALINAGAAHVSLIPEGWAAAIGAGIDIANPNAQTVIDIGDGITEMVIFRNGRMISFSSIRTGCSDIHNAIRSTMLTQQKLYLDDHETEHLSHQTASILKKEEGDFASLEIAGIDTVTHCKTRRYLQTAIITKAINPIINTIVTMIEVCLSQLPDKFYCEILESGILLTGGGACITGLDRLIALRTKMDVKIASDPMHSVINGSSQTLNYWRGKKCWWENIAWPTVSMS